MRVSAGQGLDALYDGVDTTVPPWPMTAQGGTGWEGLLERFGRFQEIPGGT